MKCHVIRIDNAASRQIEPAYATQYSGSIPTKNTHQQILIPETSVYRMWLQAEISDELEINRELRGHIVIDATVESFASLLWKQLFAVLIRESGV